MVSAEGKAPVFQNAPQASSCKVAFHHTFRQIGEPQSRQRTIQHLSRTVADKLAVHADPEFPAALFELPSIKIVVCR